MIFTPKEPDQFQTNWTNEVYDAARRIVSTADQIVRNITNLQASIGADVTEGDAKIELFWGVMDLLEDQLADFIKQTESRSEDYGCNRSDLSDFIKEISERECEGLAEYKAKKHAESARIYQSLIERGIAHA